MAQTFSTGQHDEDEAPEPASTPSKAESSDVLDSLLDEIDDSLQVNAEQFVRSFVQKGGQ